MRRDLKVKTDTSTNSFNPWISSASFHTAKRRINEVQEVLVEDVVHLGSFGGVLQDLSLQLGIVWIVAGMPSSTLIKLRR